MTNDSVFFVNDFNTSIPIRMSNETKLERMYLNDQGLTLIGTNKDGIPSTLYKAKIYSITDSASTSTNLSLDFDKVIKYIM
jgi:hypothetical protein